MVCYSPLASVLGNIIADIEPVVAVAVAVAVAVTGSNMQLLLLQECSMLFSLLQSVASLLRWLPSSVPLPPLLGGGSGGGRGVGGC